MSITLPEGAIQIGTPSTVPMTDRMAMVDTMAGLLTDVTTRLDMMSRTGQDYGHHAQGTVGGVPVIALAVATAWDRSAPSGRTTTTEDTALALEAIAPWAAGLDPRGVGDLTVTETPDGIRVLLALLAEGDDDRRAAVAAAVEGLPAETAAHGRRAQALLPSGHRLKVFTH
ncbi:hypothetical protein [Kitasatospora sp. NPDC088548]|uniref:hypothetical protein n=1 Tax=Kitasatospora sp. NPDC088548 TaxID=3364075 RepID=UPI00381B0664